MTKGVYCLTFPNGKKYVGYTVEKEGFIGRFRRHKSASNNIKQRDYNTKKSRAIRKYGWENIEKKILIISDDEFYCKFMETQIIAAWKLTEHKFGYNGTIGGEGTSGNKHSDEFKDRQSKRYSGKGNNNFGKTQSEYNKQRGIESNSKTHCIKFPDGSINKIYNLNNFCKENGLNRRRLYSTGDKGYSKYV